MAKFKLALPIINKHEGGWSCVEPDKGNWTGGKVGVGICAGTFRGLTAWEVTAIMGRPVTKEEMKNLDPAIQEKVFCIKYWNIIRGDEIENQETANALVDMAILNGPQTAIKMEQNACGIPETGIMDKLTLDTLNNKL